MKILPCHGEHAVTSEEKEARKQQLDGRRTFLRNVARYGFTTACLAATGSSLTGCTSSKPVASAEEQRQRSADYVMTVATGYVLGASRSYPLMQLDFKENVQNVTRGRVYVKLLPAGQLGTGAAAAQGVQTGTLKVAQHSLANFAPFAPAVDLINIPYWCNTNQRFVNLVTSQAWRNTMNPLVEARGFMPLWYVVIDPRVAALRTGAGGPIKTPEQMRGIKFRVSGSKVLAQLYRQLGASPTPIAWGETPSALKQGVADALDASVQALHICGLQDVLSWVTLNRPVADAQVYSCNKEWFDSLTPAVREGIVFASDITFQQNLAKVPAARAYAMAELSRAGVQFYAPTPAEMKQWVDAAGHHLPVWDSFKRDLGGGTEVFEALRGAAQTQSSYRVHDLTQWEGKLG